MARYLIQAAYSSESWAALVRDPEDRSAPVRAMVEKAGGRLEEFYLSFGDFDVVCIVDLPDNTSAAAVSIAASAGRGLKAIATTPLLSVTEALGALQQAQALGYEAPGHDPDMQTPMYAG
jgi:uncharacterized protein with GYD domain